MYTNQYVDLRQERGSHNVHDSKLFLIIDDSTVNDEVVCVHNIKLIFWWFLLDLCRWSVLMQFASAGPALN